MLMTLSPYPPCYNISKLVKITEFHALVKYHISIIKKRVFAKFSVKTPHSSEFTCNYFKTIS